MKRHRIQKREDGEIVVSSISSSSSSSSSGSVMTKLANMIETSNSVRGDDAHKVRQNPLDRMCEKLLDWNILAYVMSSDEDGEGRSDDWGAKKVIPIRYESQADYFSTWEPLVIEEIKAMVVSNVSTSRGSGAYTPSSDRCGQFRIGGGEGVDKNTSLVKLHALYHNTAQQEAGDVLAPKCRRDALGSMDLILLSEAPIKLPITAASVAAIAKHTVSKCCVAMVMSSNRMDGNGVMIKVNKRAWEAMKQFMQQKASIGVGSVPDTLPGTTLKTGSSAGQAALKALAGGIVVHFTHLDSLMSSWREFMALHELSQSSTLNPQLLAQLLCSVQPADGETVAGKVSADAAALGTLGTSGMTAAPTPNLISSSSSSSSVSPPLHLDGATPLFEEKLRQRYNPSQLCAIAAATTHTGFTLVQGPPGTGKTSTVLGMLNSIHLRRYNHYYESVLQELMGAEGRECRRSCYDKNPHLQKPWLALVRRVSRLKPHILVVAPSNTAVDNIIERIMEQGFFDGNGGKYMPGIIRLGAGRKGARVKSVSLEDTVEAEMNGSYDAAKEASERQKLNAAIHALIGSIYTAQSYLINLKLAFSAHILPAGWELRIAQDSAKPYWVNHIQRTTSVEPPPSPETSPAAAFPPADAVAYSSVNQLPEYAMLTHNITQFFDELLRSDIKLGRLNARTSPHEFGGVGGARSFIEQRIIEQAQIVFTTVNSAGHPSLESTEFCVTIIDEAAQAVEPAILIPLRRGCSQCIMVGDPKQLPATIFSDKVRHAGYDRSLFERLVAGGHRSILLDTQYRMAPDISFLPSRLFYGGLLKDGANVTSLSYGPAYTGSKRECLPSKGTPTGARTSLFHPLLFFDLLSSVDKLGASQSRSNPHEAMLCVNIMQTLVLQAHLLGEVVGSVGVITPYSEQLSEIRRNFESSRLIQPAADRPTCELQTADNRRVLVQLPDIELNTVDGFQGREKDIILISCVRASDTGGIGFLSDVRRMNVALTRARFGLFVVGNRETLRKNDHWGQLIAHAEASGRLVSVDQPWVRLEPLLMGLGRSSGKRQREE